MCYQHPLPTFLIFRILTLLTTSKYVPVLRVIPMWEKNWTWHMSMWATNGGNSLEQHRVEWPWKTHLSYRHHWCCMVCIDLWHSQPSSQSRHFAICLWQFLGTSTSMPTCKRRRFNQRIFWREKARFFTMHSSMIQGKWAVNLWYAKTDPFFEAFDNTFGHSPNLLFFFQNFVFTSTVCA